MSRILVTGSRGTLGEPLVRQLRANGHTVFGVDLAHDGYAPEPYQRADVADYRQMERAFAWSDPEYVYHLAAEFGRFNGEDYFEQLWRTNAIGTRVVAECCRMRGTKLIFASSSEIYGDSYGPIPLREDLTLDQPPVQANDYAISKWVNEMQIGHLARRDPALEAMTLRFFNSYGPGEHYHSYRSVVALFAWKVLHDEPITVYHGYRRSFMFIDDFIPTLARACEKFTQTTVNIGGAEVRPVTDVLDLCLMAVPEYSGQITHADADLLNVVDKIADIGRARELLDHDPQTTLEYGVVATIEWMKQQIARRAS